MPSSFFILSLYCFNMVSEQVIVKLVVTLLPPNFSLNLIADTKQLHLFHRCRLAPPEPSTTSDEATAASCGLTRGPHGFVKGRRPLLWLHWLFPEVTEDSLTHPNSYIGCLGGKQRCWSLLHVHMHLLLYPDSSTALADWCINIHRLRRCLERLLKPLKGPPTLLLPFVKSFPCRSLPTDSPTPSWSLKVCLHLIWYDLAAYVADIYISYNLINCCLLAVYWFSNWLRCRCCKYFILSCSSILTIWWHCSYFLGHCPWPFWCSYNPAVQIS